MQQRRQRRGSLGCAPTTAHHLDVEELEDLAAEESILLLDHEVDIRGRQARQDLVPRHTCKHFIEIALQRVRFLLDDQRAAT